MHLGEPYVIRVPFQELFLPGVGCERVKKMDVAVGIPSSSAFSVLGLLTMSNIQRS